MTRLVLVLTEVCQQGCRHQGVLKVTLACVQNFFRSTSKGASTQAAPSLSVVHPQGDLYRGQVIKVQLLQETDKHPTELLLGSRRVASLMVPAVANEMSNPDHQFLACLASPADLGSHQLMTNLGHSTEAPVFYHGQRYATCPWCHTEQLRTTEAWCAALSHAASCYITLACRMVQWFEHHQVEDKQYVPDGRPVPHMLAVDSRTMQLDSIVHTVTQQGGAGVIKAYDSSDGSGWDQLGTDELQGRWRFQRLHSVKELSASVFYFVDNPRLPLVVALGKLRREVGRLKATAVPHWLAVQAGQHRVNTADLAELRCIADSTRWQLEAAWSTAPPGQCCTPIVEASSDDDAGLHVALHPYLLLALSCSSAVQKSPSRQSSGASNDLTTPGSGVSLSGQSTFSALHLQHRCMLWLGCSTDVLMHHCMEPAGAQCRQGPQDPRQRQGACAGEHQASPA